MTLKFGLKLSLHQILLLKPSLKLNLSLYFGIQTRLMSLGQAMV